MFNMALISSIPCLCVTQGYEEMSLNTSDYEGKTVLILGRGEGVLGLVVMCFCSAVCKTNYGNLHR